jgi:acetyl esterase/lipase
MLEVWRAPSPAAEPAPIAIWIHGGGWMWGSNHLQSYPLLTHLADEGWLCVAINYRLSPRATWPDQLVDVKQAIAWIREHADELGGDPDRVVTIGGSAGGHLSAMAGLTAGDAELQPGFETADTGVQAFVSLYGVYDWTFDHGEYRAIRHAVESHITKADPVTHPNVFRAASPSCRVHAGAPPALIVHGGNDNLIPIADARRFAERLRATSASPTVFAELPGAQHAWDTFDSPRARATAEAVRTFLDAVVPSTRAGA